MYQQFWYGLNRMKCRKNIRLEYEISIIIYFLIDRSAGEVLSNGQLGH